MQRRLQRAISSRRRAGAAANRARSSSCSSCSSSDPGFTALVIDLGVLRNANQNLWNALDAGALAGASELPADGVAAEALAMQYAENNFPGGLPAGVTMSFRCLVGARRQAAPVRHPGRLRPGPDRRVELHARSARRPATRPRATCATRIVLRAPRASRTGSAAPSASTRARPGRHVGRLQGSCGTDRSRSVDLALIVDRTPSMSGATRQRPRAADSVRKVYNPAAQWMAFGLIGPSRRPRGVQTPATTIGTADGAADCGAGCPSACAGSARRSTRTTRRPAAPWPRPSRASELEHRHDLNDPVPLATYERSRTAATGVHKGIILMTDGQPNASTRPDPTTAPRRTPPPRGQEQRASRSSRSASGSTAATTSPAPTRRAPARGRRRPAPRAMATTSADDNGCPGTENDDGTTSSASRRRRAPARTWPSSSSRPSILDRRHEAHPAALTARLPGSTRDPASAGSRNSRGQLSEASRCRVVTSTRPRASAAGCSTRAMSLLVMNRPVRTGCAGPGYLAHLHDAPAT